LKPKFIDATTVSTDPITLRQPFTAQHQGIREGFIPLRSRMPKGSGTPSRKAVGASMAIAAATRAASGRPIALSTTCGENTTKSAMLRAIPAGTSHTRRRDDTNQLTDTRLPRPAKKRMVNNVTVSEYKG
jgi:hypothetical protein